MGNSNTKNDSKWIIITNKDKTINKYDIYSLSAMNLNELHGKFRKLSPKNKRMTINYKCKNKFKSDVYDVGSWEYYRDNTLHDTKNPGYIIY